MLLEVWTRPLAALVACMLLATRAFAVIDPTALGLRVDAGLLAMSRYVYTSRMVLPAGTDATQFTDSQLLYIAKLGYEFMATDGSLPKSKKPKAMTVMAQGDSVYIMSSLKNGGFLYEPTNAVQIVTWALQRCEATRGLPHRNGAACGEPLSAQAFFKDHPALVQADISQARVVTWGRISTGPGILVPCGDVDRWGCNDFITQLGIVAIADTTLPDDSAIIPEGVTFATPCLR